MTRRKHASGWCAERHPDPDLTHALPHGVGEHAVDADARQRQREHGKRGEQLHRERRWPSDRSTTVSIVLISSTG